MSFKPVRLTNIAGRPRGQRAVAIAADGGLWIFGLGVLVLYSSLNRPIWIDEFLHFALGNMDFREALSVVWNTTTEINHGQTGAYMLADWALLKLFGASSVALRLPSLLGGALLLFSSVIVMRLRGFARPWQYLAIAVLSCQGFLLYFVGEARPYIILAASAVATLAYYLISPNRRRGLLGLFLAFGGVFVGSINHPYYPMTLFMVLLTVLVVAWREGWPLRGWRDVAKVVDAPVLAVAATLYLVVGAMTWLRGKPNFGYDPFDNMGSFENVVAAFWRDHLGILGSNTGWALVGALTVGVVILERFTGVLDLAAPLLLGALALISSLGVSLISYVSEYWILERQWVAGIALLGVAVVWIVAQVYESASGNRRLVAAVPGLCLGWLAILGVWSTANSQSQLLIGYVEQSKSLELETRPIEELVKDEQVDWVTVGNVNIARGGEVSPVFTDWYSRQAGMRGD